MKADAGVKENSRLCMNRDIVQGSASTSTLGVTTGTPLRNLLQNHKELEGWVLRGVGRLHGDGLNSDLERSLFRAISKSWVHCYIPESRALLRARPTLHECALYKFWKGDILGILVLAFIQNGLTSRCAAQPDRVVRFSIRSHVVLPARRP